MSVGELLQGHCSSVNATNALFNLIAFSRADNSLFTLRTINTLHWGHKRECTFEKKTIESEPCDNEPEKIVLRGVVPRIVKKTLSANIL